MSVSDSDSTVITRPNEILIVDDVDKNLQLLGNSLHKEGYDVLFASSGEEALQTVAEGLPDLILLDVMMPGMSGFEVCEKLRRDPRTAEVPVIFVTALSEPSDIVDGFRAGGQDYITKPVKTAEMLVRVKTHLELQRVRRELRESNHDLQAHIDHQRHTFSILSHDLRSPISTVGVLIEEIATALKADEDKSLLEEMVEDARQSIVNLNNLMEDVLAWSRIQMDAIRFEPQDFVIEDAVDNVLAHHAPQAERKGLHFKKDLSADLVVYADINMVTTVLRNLVSNSIKFTPRGGKIIIQASKLAQGWEVAVEDTGIGMEESVIEKLFKYKEISSAQGTEEERGSGLGLSLCMGLIRKYGGDMHVRSKLGSGTRIAFTLPVSTEG